MLVLVGTIPIKGVALKCGVTKFDGRGLTIGDFCIPTDAILHGTTSMIAAATIACEALGLKVPYSVVAGDIGDGHGSREVYTFLIEKFHDLSPKVITMHYILPIKLLIMKFVKALEECDSKPVLIADAGSMYVAKSAGVAKKFDLFTPDPGELAFLADPDAEHPAYVHYSISEVDTVNTPKLIKQTYENSNSSRVLLVKGSIDYVAEDGKIVATVSEPNIPELEPIGGTGDTITGIVSALVYAGYDLIKAAIYAAKINRIAGLHTKPTPATKILEIISHIPNAIKEVMNQ